MNDWMRLFLLPIAGGLVAIVAAVIFKSANNKGTVYPDSNHKNFNIHAWYVFGILGFLLVCSLAVDWGSIPELATILSFAVGLASLILALIAIIQSLTSTNNVEASLAAVREVANDASKSGHDLAVSISAIREAAKLAESASSSALKATEELSALGTHVIRSSEEGRAAIDELRNELKVKAKLDSAKEPNVVPAGDQNIFVNSISMGGATASYAAIRAFQRNKDFTWREMLGDDNNGTFENGYLSALDDLGFLKIKRFEGGRIRILSVEQPLLDSFDYIADKPFGKQSSDEKYKKNLASIDAFTLGDAAD